MYPPYTCPCCGFLVFENQPGSHDICPICDWEDDLSQLRFVDSAGGANVPSLIAAQCSYKRVGATEERFVTHVRPPGPDDLPDPKWRAFDPHCDPFETPLDGVDYGRTYLRDKTAYYYWLYTKREETESKSSSSL
jgi:cysteine-rich CPCC protein